jgi:predicted short-subunit dehydrogenase-like oxidoreductase (DUF2520 family)
MEGNRDNMNIVIVGSGNTAAVLGRKFVSAGHKIVQIVSRNAATASDLAYEWDTESANYMSLINKYADVYIIAVSDDALEEIAKDLRLPGKLVAHTAGSVPKEVLKNITAHFGVFYPLQTLRKEIHRALEIPVFFEGSDQKATSMLQKLADSISFGPATAAKSEDRAKLHVAAVVVSNFTNHLYALTEQYCRKEGINFHQLLPLIRETVGRLETVSPSASMTGPAVRHDEETIQRHIVILDKHPQLQKVYSFMTESIEQIK